MNNNSGISIVEALVAIAIILTIGVAFASGLSQSVALSYKAVHTSQASWILEDTAEAIKTIRDESWVNISTLTPLVNQYLIFDTNTSTWSITQTDPGPVDSVFTRSFVVANVNRDINDDISTTGTNDNNTKYVTVTVSWMSGPTLFSEKIDFYISNIF